ncbi:RNA polymerase sigma-70 factor [Polaribacter sp. R2A056_3_33]|uniref:RNA polymerase sigma-70 factor n=1 Tax=Polaribacter sp. R2A056_3_33 TaxID=2745563 RepID=UPI001C4EE888|nr:RNA polymerase sigma-70 factor [Polaribacter sp. R2A056_3_33]QXP70951.1 RNA polymerase sigma-70 factor [Polaribacter sp. R2A056_3_33]
MNNHLLIAQIKKKDTVAFKKCYDLFFQDLVVSANRYVSDFSVSEDIVQEVFVYIWEHSEKIEIKTSLKAYLFVMVKNRCLNHLKSIKITDNQDYIEYSRSLIDRVEILNFTEENNTLYLKVLAIVDEMPLKMQKIFKLKFIEEYKYNEIAEELNISLNTVKTQLKRARVKINNSLMIMLFCLIIINDFLLLLI